MGEMRPIRPQLTSQCDTLWWQSVVGIWHRAAVQPVQSDLRMGMTVLASARRGVLVNKAALWAWLVVAIPVAALFGPVLATDRSFAMRDAGHFYYPLFEWCCREWAAGRVPLWNPFENCGLPVLADTTSSVFYPGKLIFLLPIEFADRIMLYILLHVIWAACGSSWLSSA